jgi:Spirocyclase AveC-like
MSALQDQALSTAAPLPSRPATTESVAERKTKPIKWWAAAGVLFVLLEAYVLTRWIASGQATPTPTGRDPIPGYTRVAIVAMEVSLPLLALATIWFYLIKPWRRAGQLTTDGMLLLGWLSAYFLQDTVLNYTQTWFLYNSYQLNLGSWNSQIPGWLSPSGHLLPEPMLIWGPGYIVLCFLIPCVLGCKFLRWLRQRRPQSSKAGAIATLYAVMVAYDIVMEVPFLRLNTYAYAGSIRPLTLFAGHTYQFPIYEALLAAFWFTIPAAVRYYVDDRGRTFVERGVDDVKASPRQKRTLKCFAIIGLIQVLALGYNIGMQEFATHADAFPSGYKSWMLNGLCGKGSPYPCPGPNTDIPRGNRPYPANTPYHVSLAARVCRRNCVGMNERAVHAFNQRKKQPVPASS